MLAAGAGTRLRPLTIERPKPLCPVGTVALVDLALARVRGVVDAVAVNVHHGRSQLEAHLARDPAVHVSVEDREALGTAGAIGHLRAWLDGRGCLILNGDTWCTAELDGFVTSWDRERVRVLVHGSDEFGPRSRIVASLLPAADAERLKATPSGLYEVVWRDAAAAGRLEGVGTDAPFVDCGTPAQYLEANRLAVACGSARSTVDPTARIDPGARLEDAVVWDGAEVGDEQLVHAIRTSEGRTVLVR